jgi:hypothetical protein
MRQELQIATLKIPKKVDVCIVGLNWWCYAS